MRVTGALCSLWLAGCAPATSSSVVAGRGETPVVVIGSRQAPVLAPARPRPSEPSRAARGDGATSGKRVPALDASKNVRNYPGLIPLSGSYQLKRDDVLRSSPGNRSAIQARLTQGSLVEAQGVLAGWLLVTTRRDGRTLTGWIPLPATQADAGP